ncbi:transposase domain-containing protein, partial [Escherichia coli]|uniref:transposase domain-containing protein n=1 Tax=Escherichia coli TaxID=562 RepID=UPI002022C8DE
VSLGRKNYLFFGSDHGGERGALLYSLIGTCKLNGVEPESYLRSLFRILCKYLFSEVAVQAVTELDNKAAHCHTPVPQWHRPFL